MLRGSIRGRKIYFVVPIAVKMINPSCAVPIGNHIPRI